MIIETKRKSMSVANCKLVAAHLDLSNLRWQMIAGLSLACLAAIVMEVFAPSAFNGSDRPYVIWAQNAMSAGAQKEHCHLPTSGVGKFLAMVTHAAQSIGESMQTSSPTNNPLSLFSLLLDFSIWRHEHFGFLITNLLLHCTCVVLISLIVLEMTGQFGNRSGGAAAIWAAALFAVNPSAATTLFSLTGRTALFACIFLLAAVFFSVRYRLLREDFYRNLALVSVIFVFFSVWPERLCVTDKESVFPARTLNNTLFPLIFQNTMCATAFRTLYIIPPALFLFRLLAGGISRNAFGDVILSVAPIAVFLFFPGFPSLVLVVCCMAGLSLLLPLLALPAIDSASRKGLMIFNGLGMLSLSLIFLSWCAIQSATRLHLAAGS